MCVLTVSDLVLARLQGSFAAKRTSSYVQPRQGADSSKVYVHLAPTKTQPKVGVTSGACSLKVVLAAIETAQLGGSLPMHSMCMISKTCASSLPPIKPTRILWKPSSRAVVRCTGIDVGNSVKPNSTMFCVQAWRCCRFCCGACSSLTPMTVQGRHCRLGSWPRLLTPYLPNPLPWPFQCILILDTFVFRFFDLCIRFVGNVRIS